MQKMPWRPSTAGCMTVATYAYRWQNTDGHRRTQDTVVVVVLAPDRATAVVDHVPVPAGAVHTHAQDLAQTDVTATNASGRGQDLNVVTINGQSRVQLQSPAPNGKIGRGQRLVTAGEK